MQQLERRATQFRAVQKRLLVRFKDRNPEPLKHLDDLLHSTYRHLVELGKRAQELTDAIRARRWEMGAALRLIALLARLQHRLGDAEGEALEAFISPEALDARETSWEQVRGVAKVREGKRETIWEQVRGWWGGEEGDEVGADGRGKGESTGCHAAQPPHHASVSRARPPLCVLVTPHRR